MIKQWREQWSAEPSTTDPVLASEELLAARTMSFNAFHTGYEHAGFTKTG